jgi:hypothetical protein
MKRVQRRKETACLEVFVGCFLPFFGHGLRRWSCEMSGNIENDAGKYNAVNGVREDFEAFARWRFSTRTVGAKCNPVSCSNLSVDHSQIHFIPS